MSKIEITGPAGLIVVEERDLSYYLAQGYEKWGPEPAKGKSAGKAKRPAPMPDGSKSDPPPMPPPG